MREKKLYRSKDKRIIAGVAGGLGEYFNLDAWIFRIGFIALSFFSGLGLVLYLALWIIMPRETGWKIRASF